jgi:fimbrial chaperone protein
MNLVFIFLFIPLVFAFKFHPMSQSIELGEKQRAVQFWLENDSDEKLGIELTVTERIMDENGKETLPPSSELTIFPPQVIIPPKEKRAVRVTWMGEDNLKIEKAFRVIAEQLPVKVGKTTTRSGIQMLMKYMAALYVNPANTKSDVTVVSVKNVGQKLSVTLKNKGNRHQIIAKPVLTLKSSSGKKILKDKEMVGLAGENVLAESQRTFLLPLGIKVENNVEAVLEFED